MSYLQGNKGALKRKSEYISTRQILIVTEGQVTEEVYFKWLKKELRLSSVKIDVIGVGADPLTVVKKGEEHYELAGGNYDTVYCIVDRDKHPPKKILEAKDQVLKKKNKSVFRFVISLPCIEYWFMLHFKLDKKPYEQPIKKSGGSMGRICKSKFKKECYNQYDETNKTILTELFSKEFDLNARVSAIERARELMDLIEADDNINPTTMLFIPAIDLEILGGQLLPEHKIKPIEQKEYEEYIESFFKRFK